MADPGAWRCRARLRADGGQRVPPLECQRLGVARSARSALGLGGRVGECHDQRHKRWAVAMIEALGCGSTRWWWTAPAHRLGCWLCLCIQQADAFALSAVASSRRRVFRPGSAGHNEDRQREERPEAGQCARYRQGGSNLGNARACEEERRSNNARDRCDPHRHGATAGAIPCLARWIGARSRIKRDGARAGPPLADRQGRHDRGERRAPGHGCKGRDSRQPSRGAGRAQARRAEPLQVCPPVGDHSGLQG